MKPKLFLLLAFSAALALTSCKKESDKNPPAVTEAEELTATSDDQQKFSTDMDEIDNDINNAVDDYAIIVGKTAQPAAALCNATVTIDTMGTTRKVTITYNGNNCQNSRSRTGVVTISIPATQRWKNAGAKLTVSFQNLKITRLADNKAITINGVKQITNVSGGRVIHAVNSTVIHDVDSDSMTLTFDNNTQRYWKIAKRRTFTYNNGLVIEVTGKHTIGNTSGVAEWGTNRFGNPFHTAIVAPMTVRQSCAFRLTSGQVKHTHGPKVVTTTFGLNAQGLPTACQQGTPFYMKIEWTGPNGNVISHLKPY